MSILGRRERAMQRRLHFFDYAVHRDAQPLRTPGGVKKGATNKISNKTQERAKTIFTGADLYVFRYVYKDSGDEDGNVSSSWELRNSKPCAHCTQLIKMAGIRYVYYSDVDVGDGEKEDSSPGIPRIVKIKAKNLFNDHLTYGRRRAAAALAAGQNP